MLAPDPWKSLPDLAAGYGLSLDAGAAAGLARYHALLEEANRHTNLTRITTPEDAVVKHALDALLFLLPLAGRKQPEHVIDIGAGAGLPGIPLALARPELGVTLVDSVGKKVAFMNQAIESLGLAARARALHGRSEDLARDPAHRDAYDLVVARALAPLNVLVELTAPFAAPGALLVFSKGAKAAEELAEARRAISELKLRALPPVETELPEGAGERTLLVFEKLGPTPKLYPRKAGLPAKSPLC